MNAEEIQAARNLLAEKERAMAAWGALTDEQIGHSATRERALDCVGAASKAFMDWTYDHSKGLLSALEACQREREHLLGFMGVEHAGCSYLATRFEPFGWACDKCGRTGAARNLVDAAALAKLQAERDELHAALTITRGQWIHSVNAEQCLAALSAGAQEPGKAT